MIRKGIGVFVKSICKRMSYAICLGLLFALSSCANLGHINSYAKSSRLCLEAHTDLGFSFSQYCTDCLPDNLTQSVQSKVADVKPADCSLYIKADSALLIFHDIILAYISGLEKLSNKDLSTINLDGMVTNLKALQGQLPGSGKFSDKQFGAAQNIVSKIVSLGLKTFQKVKLKKTITEVDSNLAVVLNYYEMALQGLQSNAALCSKNYEDFVTDEILHNAKDVGAKNLIVRDYQTYKRESDKRATAIKLYIAAIDKIKLGHHELATSKTSITSQVVTKHVIQYAQDIFSLQEQIQNLKSK